MDLNSILSNQIFTGAALLTALSFIAFQLKGIPTFIYN